ncbi:MAG: efflux RND transporter periplasmic adaptor subunit [Candidatus Aminicenantes bacterium]|nr:efflux RND transporter periplasmic adaptor subunit [Candidatus Aminicenantes bacterium]
MKKWLWRILAVIFVGVFLFLLLSGKKDKAPLKQVKVVRGTISEKALAVGTIEPEKEIKVKSIIPGIVQEVLFKVGDKVKAGDTLFKISPNPTPVEYVETRRAIEVAQVTLSKLQADRQRNLKLFEQSLISQSEMDGVESAYDDASLRHKIALERLELMEKGRIRMANRDIDSTVKSPTTGMVLSQSTFQGDPVVPLTNYQPGTELCSLADMGKLLFKGTVDEIDVGKIRIGMAADIQIGALPDSRFMGNVERIFPKAKKEGNATLFDIEILVPEAADRQLRAGYSATATITVRSKENILTLPERLVLFENGKKFVEVKKGEAVEKKEVQTGLSDGLNIEITEGLGEDEMVVERPPRVIK